MKIPDYKKVIIILNRNKFLFGLKLILIYFIILIFNIQVVKLWDEILLIISRPSVKNTINLTSYI